MEGPRATENFFLRKVCGGPTSKKFFFPPSLWRAHEQAEKIFFCAKSEEGPRASDFCAKSVEGPRARIFFSAKSVEGPRARGPPKVMKAAHEQAKKTQSLWRAHEQKQKNKKLTSLWRAHEQKSKNKKFLTSLWRAHEQKSKNKKLTSLWRAHEQVKNKKKIKKK